MNTLGLVVPLDSLDPLWHQLCPRHHPHKAIWKMCPLSHHIRGLFFPTWTHLQIIVDTSAIPHEFNIPTLDDLLGLHTHEPICVRAFTIPKKQAFCALCIKLTPLLVGHHGIRKASKHTHVWNARLSPTPRFLRCDGRQRPWGTSIPCVGRIHHRFRPVRSTICFQLPTLMNVLNNHQKDE